MTVYVDDMRAPLGRMIMCHMVADTTAELLTMADLIGVQRRWLQSAGTFKEHFDISLGKRVEAIVAGAVEIEMHELGEILLRKRKEASDG